MKLRKNDQQEQTIDVDASMQGTLVFNEPVNLRIKGKFDGTLEAQGNLIVGETAIVTAKIKCENIVIYGRVKGDIVATTRIELRERAVLEGTIKTPRLMVADGALFQGKSEMMEGVLNVEDVAKHLEIDLETVINWANTGKIPAFKEGNEWRFERRRIEDWVAAGKI